MDLPRPDPRDAAVVAFLSIAALSPLFMFDTGIEQVLDLSLGPILYLAASLLLVLPVPASYVVAISREGFRVESFASAAALPLAFLGPLHAGLAASLVLGLPLVSYKTRGLYKGDNFTFTAFRSVGSMATVLAVVLGLAAALTYQASPGLQEDLQETITNRTTEMASEYVEASRQQVVESQRQALKELASTLSRNVSSTSIALTEKTVFSAVEEAGTFTSSQKTLLRRAFDTARDDIPSRLSGSVAGRMDQLTGSAGELGDVKGMVKQRISPLAESFTAAEPPFLAFIFFTVLSLVYLAKIPFKLLGALYAGVARRSRELAVEN
ncbi:MAG: hypothetical protein SVQ76_02575 [Candidatus Nanohaloarchaea archaeon]|nr:hypothetical protein [Candidatus Nanohaloarchaea archaeon]